MKCYNHPDRDAVGVCTACGRGVCQEESLSIAGRLYCKVDAEKQFGAAAATATAAPITQEPRKKTSWKTYAIVLGVIFLVFLLVAGSLGSASSDVSDAFHKISVDQCNSSPQNVDAQPTLVRYTQPVTIKNPSSINLKVSLTLQMYISDQLVGTLTAPTMNLPPSGTYATNMQFSFSGSALDTVLKGGSATFRARGLLSGSGETFAGNMPFSQKFDTSQVMNFQPAGQAPNASSSQCEYTILGQ